MKSIFTITDEAAIYALLDRTEYGTLALSIDNRPYSLPVNFVRVENTLYFHGSKKGRKIETITANSRAAFSVVEAGSIIPSYFSSTDELACPATQFFASVMIEGRIVFVEEYDVKAAALEALMEKLQPEGGYKPLSDPAYRKAIDATTIYALPIERLSGKYKFGQHLPPERFERILHYLNERGTATDQHTQTMMQSQTIQHPTPNTQHQK